MQALNSCVTHRPIVFQQASRSSTETPSAPGAVFLHPMVHVRTSSSETSSFQGILFSLGVVHGERSSVDSWRARRASRSIVALSAGSETSEPLWLRGGGVLNYLGLAERNSLKTSMAVVIFWTFPVT